MDKKTFVIQMDDSAYRLHLDEARIEEISKGKHSLSRVMVETTEWLAGLEELDELHEKVYDFLTAKQKLEEIRAAIEDEHVSYGELAELADLKDYIDKDDVVLLEWAGVPEFPEEQS